MKYPDIPPNTWIQPVKRGFKFCCCDCALVHSMDFRIVKGRVQIKVKRDNRATGQRRRAMHVKIKAV